MDWKSVVAWFLENGYDISGSDNDKVVLRIPVFKDGIYEDWETVVILKKDLDASFVTYETNRSVPGKVFCGADGKWYDNSAECNGYYVLLKEKYPHFFEG